MTATIAHERAGREPRAILAATRSCLPAFNDHQGDDAAPGKCAWGLRRLPHGHVGHVGVHDEPQGSIDILSSFLSVVPLSNVLSNWRRVRPASFSHSNRVAIPSLSQTRKRAAGLLLPLAVRTLSARPGSSQTPRQSLTHQHLVRVSADVPDHLNRLSSLPSLDGFKPIEKDVQRRGNLIRNLVRSSQRLGSFVQGSAPND